MRLFRQRPPQSLSKWLDIATRRLVPSAQARIRTEIEEHFNEAMRTRIANGLSEPIARAAALADLGDAKIAAQHFRQKYLTRFEAYRLREAVKGSIAWEIAAAFFYWLLPFGILICSPRADFLPSWLLLAAFCGPILVLIASRLAIRFLVKRSASATALGNALLVRLLANLVYASAILAAGWHLRSNILHAKLGAISGNDTLQLAAVVSILIYCACAGCYQYHLRQKLLNTGENWNSCDYLAVWP